MPDPAAIHSTFVLERRYPRPPARVFAAFADADRKRRWMGESDSHTVEKFESDFRVGGVERMRYRYGVDTPLKGAAITSEGLHLDIVPDRRIVIASNMAFDHGPRFSASLVTFEFFAEDGGTLLVCTHQGAFFEGADGPDLRKGGWEALLARLAAETTR